MRALTKSYWQLSRAVHACVDPAVYQPHFEGMLDWDACTVSCLTTVYFVALLLMFVSGIRTCRSYGCGRALLWFWLSVRYGRSR